MIEKYTNGAMVEVGYDRYENSTDTLTTLPAEIIADGNSATVGLQGNMSQTGTPTPANPIQPSECGKRTEQLIPEFLRGSASSSGVNFEQIDSMTIRAYGELSSYVQQVSQISFKLTAGTYYLMLYSTNSDTKFYPQIRSVDGQTTYRTGNGSFTLTEDTVVVPRFVGSSSTATIIDENIKLMLNVGSQPLPFEPYGYKIPISSGGVTTNIYLGSTQTVRQIGKLILTGEENWNAHATIGNWYYADNIFSPIVNVGAYCDKYNFTSYSTASALTNGQFTFGNPGGDLSRYRLIFKDTTQATVTDFKTYLQQQYANGTPVTVWYVLATSETAAVNEPLMKIGDYADSITGLSIPTTGTAEQFDVDTPIKPSEVSLTYTGWHNKSDHKF